MKRYFDPYNKRLVWVESVATPNYWDEHWQNNIKNGTFNSPAKHKFISSITGKYLPGHARILEGGCGLGDKVYALDDAGYDSFGVDYAENTVRMIKQHWPHLKIKVGDVRHLPFEDKYFDGYWSLGVIEHFFKGYKDIASEMARVIRPGGYLFLTFPYMSPLRRFKSKLGLFTNFTQSEEPPGFYQFALDYNNVISELSKYGFTPQKIKAMGGLKGLKDEIPLIRHPFQKLFDYSGSMIVIKVLRLLLDRLLALLGTGHTILLVLKKEC